MEPMNVEYPKDNFLEKVKELVHKNNALLIFDETITGFRYSLGDAQELFGVVPDLATFGKGITSLLSYFLITAFTAASDKVSPPKVPEKKMSSTFCITLSLPINLNTIILNH
jgi:glutamate-1-semialdehyde aminotransferase